VLGCGSCVLGAELRRFEYKDEKSMPPAKLHPVLLSELIRDLSGLIS